METTFTHKCPNCGGPLLFNPKDQKFHCEYCLNIYTEEEVTRYEQQQHEAHLESLNNDCRGKFDFHGGRRILRYATNRDH